MPRSSIRGPSGTEKSAVTRINNSCRARRRGRNAASSPNSNPVRSRNSRALATLVKLFSGRKIVHRWRSFSGTWDSIPGFQGPNSARLTAAASVMAAAADRQGDAWPSTAGSWFGHSPRVSQFWRQVGHSSERLADGERDGNDKVRLHDDERHAPRSNYCESPRKMGQHLVTVL